MDKKGIFIPPLAYALIVILIIVLIATFVPAVKETILEIFNSIFG